jgi:spermidine/putrescine transport system permease protein
LRQTLLMLIIIPFWTNFLIRVFAWKSIMHPDGIIKRTLLFLGLVEPNTQLLYNDYSILVVLIYTHLPFAILPIYAAAEKFDFRLMEAARDLGAGALRAFWSIFVPGIRRGLMTALLMVLIPAMGSYVIPDIMGGPTSEMIGNKIAQRTFSDRNLPQASALAALLTFTVLGPLVAALLVQGNRSSPARKPEGAT